MIALPVAIIEAVQNVDMSVLMSAINQYGPAWEVIRSTWSKETIKSLMDGHIAVPEKVINDALAEQLENSEDNNIKSMSVACHENGKMDILADTKSIGRVEISGTFEKFVHNKDESVMHFKVKERALKDQGLLSWFVSRMPLSMTQQLMGKIDVSDEIPVKIKGNTVMVDFKESLQKSKLAEKQVNGHPVLDMIEIEEAVPKDGYIDFKTKLNIPDDVKDMFKSILSKQENKKEDSSENFQESK